MIHFHKEFLFTLALGIFLLPATVFSQENETEPVPYEPLISQKSNPVPTKAEETIDNVEKNIVLEHKSIGIEIPEDNPLIQKYRKEYISNFGKQWLNKVMKNAEPYRLFIRKELEKRNMPAFLEYLPAVESSFSIRAISKSGATGLWQFMENSIKPYMHKNQWIDERYDPWVSTDAALRKLQENYNTLGSWELALAAYNFGLGGITRLIKANPDMDYWELGQAGKLKSETKNYVPRLLVIADYVTNASYYGIELPELSEKDWHNFEEISVSAPYDITIIAEKSGIPLETLEFFNPSLKFSVTPPNIEYQFRFPAGQKDIISKTLASIDPEEPRFYTVKKGDTLWSISRRFNVDLDELCTLNKISQTDILPIKKVLKLPIYK